jgi:hypothetical protein
MITVRLPDVEQMQDIIIDTDINTHPASVVYMMLSCTSMEKRNKIISSLSDSKMKEVESYVKETIQHPLQSDVLVANGNTSLDDSICIAQNWLNIKEDKLYYTTFHKYRGFLTESKLGSVSQRYRELTFNSFRSFRKSSSINTELLLNELRNLLVEYVGDMYDVFTGDFQIDQSGNHIAICTQSHTDLVSEMLKVIKESH